MINISCCCARQIVATHIRKPLSWSKFSCLCPAESTAYCSSSRNKSSVIGIMETVTRLIPELKQSHVHVKDWISVEKKILALVAGNHDKLQIVADFDFTLTKFHVNGARLPSCHGVIENYSGLPPMFKEKSKEMFEKYYPIELDPHIPLSEKIPLMIEWYDGAHNLMEQVNLYRKDFALMVEESPVAFRDGTKEFMKDLNEKKVPILVFSAGVGDVIDEALRYHGLVQDNVKVISNYMNYNSEDKVIRFTGSLIHMYNKNETAVPHSATYFQDLSHRHNVILLGDSLGDLQMSKGVEPPSTVLTIGFLNDKIAERLEIYKDQFDIVLVDDQTIKIPHSIFKLTVLDETAER